MPSGSKDSTNRVLGPKFFTINGIGVLKPNYLGPWTFRDVHSVVSPPKEASRPSLALHLVVNPIPLSCVVT